MALARYGWDNDSFAADASYLETVAARAALAKGPILECGSGVSTIVLAAMKLSHRVISLEHNPAWLSMLRLRIEQLGLSSPGLTFAPLKSYGEFDWYELPSSLPTRFSLVICDGPPGTVRGGRYGLAPLLGDRLEPGATIVLDDAEREQERQILSLWEKQFLWRPHIEHSAAGALAIIQNC